jgi:hypothetical protein
MILLVVPFFAACAHDARTLQSFSAGQVGCPPEEITISDQQGYPGLTTWKAECDGKIYHCSSSATKESITTNCKERPRKSEKAKPEAQTGE